MCLPWFHSLLVTPSEGAVFISHGKNRDWKSIWQLMSLKSSAEYQIKPKRFWNLSSDFPPASGIQGEKEACRWSLLCQQLSLNHKVRRYCRGLTEDDVIWPAKTWRPKNLWDSVKEASVHYQRNKNPCGFIVVWEMLNVRVETWALRYTKIYM